MSRQFQRAPRPGDPRYRPPADPGQAAPPKPVRVPERFGRPDPAKQADKEEQEARPWQAFRSGYYALLGPAPRCGPGECWKARDYWERIEEVRQRGGWSHSETANLSTLAKRWGKRAAGKDVRFNLFGNRPGRLTRDEDALVRKMERA